MLERMDRVVVAAGDGRVGAAWERFLDARPDGDGEVPALRAVAHRWRIGDGWLEVLQPDGTGSGPVADAVAARGTHLFAGGFTTADVDAFTDHLEAVGVRGLADGDRTWLDGAAVGVPGLRVVVGRDAPQPAVGLLDRFYETSVLVPDAAAGTDRSATVLGLDPSTFVPIESPHYGYEGTLTLFDADRLDRLEIITPVVPGTTMHRWFQRNGSGLYMAFAESAALAEVEDRVRAAGAGVTAEPSADRRGEGGAHTLFLHPTTLGGMMLGVSRRDHAWTWSGQPERAGSSR